MAAKNLKMQKIPCVFAENLTEQQRRAYIIADNKLTELAAWDNDKLKIELQELTELNFDISLTGFDDKDFDFKIDLGFDENNAKASELDEIGEISEENKRKIKPGDIYILGNHKLICGDCTDAAVIYRLMDGVKADMVFTDPPYGMKKESKGVHNDNLNFDDLLNFNREWIPLTFEALKDNGSWYCWGIDEPLMDIYSNILKPMIKENKITFRNLITWFKGNAQGEKSDMFRSYPRASEKCLFVMCGAQGFKNNQDNYFEGFEPVRRYLAEEAEKVGLTPQKLKEICGVGMFSHWFGKSEFSFITEEHYKELQNYYSGDAFKKDYDALKKDYYATRAYFDNTHDAMTDVWIYESNPFGETRKQFLKEIEDAGGHATPKPIALCSRAIKSSSREGEIVLDVFGGSGSTLIACENTGRNCYICEIEPRWCNVIIDRWEKMSGKVAFKAE